MATQRRYAHAAPHRFAPATRRRQADTWFGRLGNELYLGAVVLAGIAVVGGLIAALIEFAIGVSDWVTMVG